MPYRDRSTAPMRHQKRSGSIYRVVARRELVASGFDRSWIKRRVYSGRLVTVLPGVYRLEGATVLEPGRYRAACLQAGPGRSGLRDLRLIVEDWISEMEWTASRLEEHSLQAFERNDLPRPLVNHPVGRWIVDF